MSRPVALTIPEVTSTPPASTLTSSANVETPATVRDCACTLRPWVPTPVKLAPDPEKEVAVTTPVA